MKKGLKAVLLVVCAIALVVTSVFATLAYLTDNDSVENTFTVGNVDITLDEADTDDSTADADRDQKNVYHLIPGSAYAKDPTVHIADGSEDAWVYVYVQNGLSDIESDATGYESVATQIAKNWTAVEGVDGLYKYSTNNGVAGAGENLVVFTGFTVDADIDNATLADYADANITVKAFAIQAENMDDATALAAAKEAFEIA